jgi:serine/threonine protein kinase
MDWFTRASNLAKAAYTYYYPPANTTLIGPEDNPEKYYIYKNKKLGEGAFGTVYKGGENKEDGKQLVIKKLKTSRYYGIDPRESFDREVECLKKVKPICDNFDVICFVDAFKFKNSYYIVTPLLDGYITLYDFVTNNKDHKINQQMANEIKNKLRLTLQKLHQIGIQHNDLHFGNIMIDPKQGIEYEGEIQVKFIDFGLCTDNANPQNFFTGLLVKGVNLIEELKLKEIFAYIDQKVLETKKDVKPLRRLGAKLDIDNLEGIVIEDYKKTSPSRGRRGSRGSKSPVKATEKATGKAQVKEKRGSKSPGTSKRGSPGKSSKEKQKVKEYILDEYEEKIISQRKSPGTSKRKSPSKK